MAGVDPAAGTRAGGLFGSIKKLVATLVEVAHTRLQLLANEIHEERVRLQQLWLLAILAIFFFALGVFLATLFVILLFWDSNRILVMGGFAGLYLVIGITLAVV
ncbi:MAG: phage holin family protein, partial [Betaproteobacteria bacterium]